MTIPAWLQRHLETIGRWDTDGITRRARMRRCRMCKASVIAGLDSDICAVSVLVDPAPLDASAELAALISGRQTFRLSGGGISPVEIDHRSQFHIRHSPPSDECIVVAEHSCGKPLAEIPRPKPLTNADSAEVPF